MLSLNRKWNYHFLHYETKQIKYLEKGSHDYTKFPKILAYKIWFKASPMKRGSLIYVVWLKHKNLNNYSLDLICPFLLPLVVD